MYDKFQQYLWDETDGYMPDHKETKKIAMKVVDEIQDSFYFSESEEKLTEDLIYWNNVKVELLKL